ncbi:tetratricopeptide repeat protein [Novosphingobium tardum]|uniref:Tetratricopeptide repeat protein n=1 Tax=Novosphingobium tardum TaxID=1538021 RepID=A0ABV8RN52_9SPHN
MTETATTTVPSAPAVAEAAPAAPTRVGRIALAAAALIAIAAVGIAAWRGQQDTAAPPAATALENGQQPSVETVIARLEARIKQNPDDAEGWRMLGWSYFQTQRFAEAATAMKRATALDPRNPEYFSMLGESLVMAGKDGEGIPPDARAAFARALALDPKDARARYFQAVQMDLDGKHAAAIDAWFALLADSPADAPWTEDVRQVIRSVGKENGIEVDKRLAATSPAPPANGFATEGPARAAAGIPGPTREQMQAASQLPQGQQDAMVTGMVDGLEAKLKANPANASGWIMLMRSRMQLGQPAKAQAALNEALAAFRNDGATSRQLREAAATLGVPAG